MGSFDVLDLGLFGGRIDMCWNFNDCGNFVGGDSGVGYVLAGWVKSGGKPSQGLVLWGFVVVGRG